MANSKLAILMVAPHDINDDGHFATLLGTGMHPLTQKCIIDFVNIWGNNLAATVKAVPSEALDGVVSRKAFICTGCNCVYADEPVSTCDCMVTPQSYIEGEITYFAAPLADKTGGGE